MAAGRSGTLSSSLLEVFRRFFHDPRCANATNHIMRVQRGLRGVLGPYLGQHTTGGCRNEQCPALPAMAFTDNVYFRPVATVDYPSIA